MTEIAKTEMARKILLVTEKPFASSAVAGIESALAGHELKRFEKYESREALLEALRLEQPDAVIIRSDIADVDFFNSAGARLKIIVRAGAGVDNIDLEAASKSGVVVMNTPGQNSNAVAELAFGMMVSHARNKFNGEGSGYELRGKTLGLYGCGNVGRYMCKIAAGFGMKIIAFDPYVSEAAMKELGAEPTKEGLTELFATSDFVSLHIPATGDTKKSINKDLLQLLPKHGVLINTARSEVIHEEDLAQFLLTRPDCGYLADVQMLVSNLESVLGEERFEKQVFITPKKIGAQTVEANNNAGPAAAKQILDFFQTGDVRFQVNK